MARVSPEGGSALQEDENRQAALGRENAYNREALGREDYDCARVVAARRMFDYECPRGACHNPHAGDCDRSVNHKSEREALPDRQNQKHHRRRSGPQLARDRADRDVCQWSPAE
jgi:hypothetical protein